MPTYTSDVVEEVLHLGHSGKDRMGTRLLGYTVKVPPGPGAVMRPRSHKSHHLQKEWELKLLWLTLETQKRQASECLLVKYILKAFVIDFYNGELEDKSKRKSRSRSRLDP